MKKKLLFGVIALQALWVIATITIQESRLRHGTVVKLETAPVDPRDFLRGDYVILNYKISALPTSLFSTAITNDLSEGISVYVKLGKHGEFYEAEAASFTEFKTDRAHPVLHGKTLWSWMDNNTTNKIVRVNYGLERFYVREGTGNPTGKLTAEAVVPASGRAILRQVYIDGRPYAEAMKR